MHASRFVKCLSPVVFKRVGTGCCQGRILRHGKGRHYPPFYLALGISSPHGQEEGLRLETLWWYRRLNTATVPDRYLLPNITDVTSRISGSTVFSKLDLQKGYYQVPVAPEDVMKTAIITPFGMFKFLRMPFGLCNAGNTFQRMMDQVLWDLPFCFVYVDDILIFSKNLSLQVDHLHEVFLLCRQHGLTIGLPKCEFAVSKIEFLGHLLSPNGCSPLTKHSANIFAFPPPSDKPALQRFLGMLK